MKHYKSPTNEVWAYEEDGSQDHIIPEDFVPISQEEANELNHQKMLIELGKPLPALTKEQLMAKLQELQAQIMSLEQGQE